MINRTPVRDRPGALGWRRGSEYRGSRVMLVEGRGLSSRPTQDAGRDREIGQPSNFEKCSETADGVTRESEGGSRLSLGGSVARQQCQARRNGAATWNESDPQHHFVPERDAVAPARVQSRRKIGLQHQYRLGRQSGRTGGQVLGDYLAEHLFEPIAMTCWPEVPLFRIGNRRIRAISAMVAEYLQVVGKRLGPNLAREKIDSAGMPHSPRRYDAEQ